MFSSFKSREDFNSSNERVALEYVNLCTWLRAIDNRMRHVELQLKLILDNNKQRTVDDYVGTDTQG